MECPKCGYVMSVSAKECPRCNIYNEIGIVPNRISYITKHQTTYQNSSTRRPSLARIPTLQLCPKCGYGNEITENIVCEKCNTPLSPWYQQCQICGDSLKLVQMPQGLLACCEQCLYRNYDKQQYAMQKDLSFIDGMEGHAFEKYVSELLIHRGCIHVEVTPGSGDYGVDIIAEYQGVKYAIQCKRHSKIINRDAISDVVGGMRHYNCSNSIVITNQHFSSKAKRLAESNNCILIEREKLHEWICDLNDNKLVVKLF